jgi:hypothetical protein
MVFPHAWVRTPALTRRCQQQKKCFKVDFPLSNGRQIHTCRGYTFRSKDVIRRVFTIWKIHAGTQKVE